MYNLPYFKDQDPEVVMAFIKANPFAFIAGVNELLQPIATQIPVFIDEKDGRIFLSGHIMKQTDHHKAFLHNANVLVVFTGPHTYVSASWYTDQKQASTWNYMSVHAKGQIRFLDDEALREILKRTTDHFENNSNSGSNYKDLPEEYISKHLKAIIAFDIEVTGMDHVFKLSQNHNKQNYQSIISELDKGTAESKAVASEMKKREEDRHAN